MEGTQWRAGLVWDCVSAVWARKFVRVLTRVGPGRGRTTSGWLGRSENLRVSHGGGGGRGWRVPPSLPLCRWENQGTDRQRGRPGPHSWNEAACLETTSAPSHIQTQWQHQQAPKSPLCFQARSWAGPTRILIPEPETRGRHPPKVELGVSSGGEKPSSRIAGLGDPFVMLTFQ